MRAILAHAARSLGNWEPILKLETVSHWDSCKSVNFYSTLRKVEYCNIQGSSQSYLFIIHKEVAAPPFIRHLFHCPQHPILLLEFLFLLSLFQFHPLLRHLVLSSPDPYFSSPSITFIKHTNLPYPITWKISISSNHLQPFTFWWIRPSKCCGQERRSIRYIILLFPSPSLSKNLPPPFNEMHRA